MKLTGLKAPKKTQGQSLVPILKDPDANVKPGAISFAKGTSWRTKNWTYIRYSNGEEELSDVQNDPDQITNLTKSEKHKPVIERISKGLRERTSRK